MKKEVGMAPPGTPERDENRVRVLGVHTGGMKPITRAKLGALSRSGLSSKARREATEFLKEDKRKKLKGIMDKARRRQKELFGQAPS